MHEGAQFPGHAADPGQEARESLLMSMSEKGRIPEVSPGTDVGGYVVETRLGEGGFGTVFRARRGGQLYAVKMLPLEEVGEWGVREMLTLARVQHPNVVRLLGHGQWPDQSPRYFVVIMEYVPGRRLDVWASTENPSAREVVGKVLGVARALAAIHRVKVVHRDVKEANILVRDATGEVVLVDFGVGSDEEASWRTGGVLPPATPDYRSPEAWLFEKENKDTPGAHYRPTPSDDLYALGVVLYWLLTNRKPFYVEGRKGVAAVLTEPPKPPHILNPRVPVELSELCLRLLAKKPEDRHPDAQALCLALTELLEQQETLWETPLCEAFNEHTVTTRPGPGADELAVWVKQARENHARPRRGRRPLLVAQVEVLDPVAGPPLPAPIPAAAASPPIAVEAAVASLELPEVPALLPVENALLAPVSRVPALDHAPPSPARIVEQQISPRATRSSRRVAVGLTLSLIVGLGMICSAISLSFSASPPPLSTEITGEPRAQPSEFISGTTWEVGWKVAYPWNPPEATRRDFLVTEEAALQPASSSHEKGEASVKDPQQKQPKGLGSVAKMIGTGITCATMACTGPQVRPTPPPEDCPSGAIEAMGRLRIAHYANASATFFATNEELVAENITVRAGPTTVHLMIPLGDLPPRTMLSGRLIIGGDRVYGRLTEARTPKGERFPVCMQIVEDATIGLRAEPNTGSNSASVYPVFDVRAVRRFE